MAFLGGYGLDLSSTLDIGMGVGSPSGDPADVPARVDPRSEYVVAANSLALGGGPDLCYSTVEDRFGGPLAWHGVAEYERMYVTPIVGSSLNALRAAVLSNPINLLPAIKPSSAAAKPGQSDGTAIEADMAAEIADSNRRLLDAWETPADVVLWEFLESLHLGHVLGEVIADDVSGGPDDGLLAITDVRPKDRSTYQFRVDRLNNVIAIRALAYDAGTQAATMRTFDPGHFAWMTNDPYRGDPRGRSCLRMAHYHWRLLTDLWPEVWKGWQQFGVPMLYGTTAPGAKMVQGVGKDGKPTAGPGVTAEFAMAMSGQRMRNGSVAAGPFDSNWKVIESTKDSSVAATGISVLEGQIVRAILLQLRATVEAKHGSKADSETGQDIMGTLVRYKRKQCERFVRSLLIKQNAWNYGLDIARRLTPLVDLGSTEHQDFAANSSGVATLFQSGYFTGSQLPFVDTFLGLPQRRPADTRIGPQGAMSDAPAVDPNAPPSPEPQGQAAAA